MTYKKAYRAIVWTQMPGHHSRYACMITSKVAVRSKMPECHSFSALVLQIYEKIRYFQAKAADFLFLASFFRSEALDGHTLVAFYVLDYLFVIVVRPTFYQVKFHECLAFHTG